MVTANDGGTDDDDGGRIRGIDRLRRRRGVPPAGSGATGGGARADVIAGTPCCCRFLWLRDAEFPEFSRMRMCCVSLLCLL